MRKLTLKYNKGAAMLIAVVFFLFASMTIILGVVNPILKQASVSKNIIFSKESFFAASAALEDGMYRLKEGKTVTTGEVLTLNGHTTTLTITDTIEGKTLLVSGDRGGLIRKRQAKVVLGEGATFNFGVQVGNGGFILENSSRVTGNIYSSGPITGAGNTIDGDAVSSGPAGQISGIHTEGSAYAHTISNSTIDGNAYYVVKNSTTVLGTSYPGSADQPFYDLPVSDEQIESLKADALAGGVISSPCPYKITTNTTLGPKKINCDLEIIGATLTLKGPVWVEGNITIQTNSTLKVDTSLVGASAPLISDKTTDRLSSSVIDIKNSTIFQGSGSPTSYIFLISMNNSAENGGSVEAISMENNSSGRVILYASHGLVSIGNSAQLKEVTGYKIRLTNSANVIYESGLTNVLFSSGPSGGWTISSWQEVE